MLTWFQSYTPILNNLALSALVAALPVVVLLGLLAFFRVKAYVAALLGLTCSLLIALLVYHMPVPLALMATAMALPTVCFPSAGSSFVPFLSMTLL